MPMWVWVRPPLVLMKNLPAAIGVGMGTTRAWQRGGPVEAWLLYVSLPPPQGKQALCPSVPHTQSLTCFTWHLSA